LFACPPERIQVIYNGVNPKVLLALSDPGLELINRLNLWDSDLNLLMPIRVTKLKNVELALRVLASLEKRGASSRLVITGPPDPHDSDNMEYFRSLLRLRAELGVSDQARFVYESGAEASELLTIEMPIVAEILRMSDAILMPSHHEGFGMPILEAGMLGIPVFCADTIPAANEIGRQNVTQFSPNADPDEVADLILRWAEHSSLLHLRRQVRQTLTWRGIFKRQILPLLIEACYEV
jgi:glycosyltransferase involved in cell wall biosynthesis